MTLSVKALVVGFDKSVLDPDWQVILYGNGNSQLWYTVKVNIIVKELQFQNWVGKRMDVSFCGDWSEQLDKDRLTTAWFFTSATPCMLSLPNILVGLVFNVYFSVQTEHDQNPTGLNLWSLPLFSQCVFLLCSHSWIKLAVGFSTHTGQRPRMP